MEHTLITELIPASRVDFCLVPRPLLVNQGCHQRQA